MKKIITLFFLAVYAIAAHAQHTGDYRSVKSGNWTDFANVWQKYNGSKWIAATTYPTRDNNVITISDTTNVTINLDLTIDQTIVAPGGQLILNSSYTVTLAGSSDAITVNGLFSWYRGTVSGKGSIKIVGSLLWSGGDLQSSLTNKGTIAINGNVGLYSTLNNNGTINWYSNDIYFENGSFINNSTFNVFSTGNMYNSNGGTFTNSGTGVYNQTNGNSTSQTNITFNNKGVMNLNGGLFLVNSGTFTNTNKINFNNGYFQNNAISNFNAGTVITGTGNIIEAYNSLSVNLALTLPAGVTMHITNSGTLAGSGPLKISGEMDWDAGTLSVALNVLSTATLNISNGNVDLSSKLTNNGVVNWSSDYITFYAGTIINNKKFNVYGNGILNNSSSGTFTNNAGATFVKLVGSGKLTNDITFNNAGTVNITSGEFYNNGTFSNTSVINLDNGNFENASTSNFNAGTSFTGKGAVIASYNTININRPITLPANIILYITNSGSIAGSDTLKITGKMYWYDGEVNVPLNILNDATLYIGANDVTLYSTLTNYGTVNWVNGYIYFYGGNIRNNKVFNIRCDAHLYESSSGTFTNNKTGTVVKSSLGTTYVDILFTNKGVIEGVGDFYFASNLTNLGTFAPGVNNATGILESGTDYINKKLTIKMNSASPGLGYDRLLVDGNVTLGSDTIEVIASDTMPSGSYTVLKWTGIRTGTIKVKNLPSGYTVSYEANKLMVNVPEGFVKNTEPAEDAALSSTLNNKAFSVFPNPATSTINFNYAIKNTRAMVQIFNADGNQVWQSTIIGSGTLKIDVSKLAGGMYILQLNDGAIKQTAKFIKQ